MKRSCDWLRLTVDGRLARQDDHHQLQTLVGVLEVAEHGLHAVRPLGVLAEAGLTLDGHPSVPGDLPQLVGEGSGTGGGGGATLGHAHHRPWRLFQREVNFNLLEEQFGALPLGGEAGDGPHLDLDAGVELLVPHVPHALDGRGYRLVL